MDQIKEHGTFFLFNYFVLFAVLHCCVLTYMVAAKVLHRIWKLRLEVLDPYRIHKMVAYGVLYILILANWKLIDECLIYLFLKVWLPVVMPLIDLGYWVELNGAPYIEVYKSLLDLVSLDKQLGLTKPAGSGPSTIILGNK